MNNIELFNLCFQHLESCSDPAYIHTGNIRPIITEDRNNPNQLMLANNALIENIAAYKVARDSNNQEMMDTAVNNIIAALSTRWMNCTEFSSYRATRDMSYSVYSKTLKSDTLKKDFINDILPHYLEERYGLYNNHWYSYITLQAVSDSKAHKANWESWLTKVDNMLNQKWFIHYTNGLEWFISGNKIYIHPDKTEKNLFHSICDYYGIAFEWSTNHDNKETDFLIKYNWKLYIMEHKHMKESWGWQDKQMNEIIDFVSYSDINEVSYISFLDWIYFNVIANGDINGHDKPDVRKLNIINNLNNNPNNYFVNTFWFDAFLDDIMQPEVGQ